MYDIDDVSAFLLHRDHNWAYNKLLLYQKLNYRAYPHGVEINTYPVISKPIMNLWGLGLGVERWTHSRDCVYRPGHLWMEEFTGAWRSWDIDRINQIAWCATAACEQVWQATPSSWSVEKLHISSLPHNIKRQLDVLDITIPKINVETIGDNIIEVHLRWSHEITQWYDNDNFVVDVLWSDSINTPVPAGWISLKDDTADIFAKANKPVRIAHRKR